MDPGRYPQYTRAWLAREAVGCSQTTHHSTTTTMTTYEPNSRHGTMKSRMVAEHAVPQIHVLKLCPGTDVNASVAYFKKHPQVVITSRTLARCEDRSQP